MAALCPWSPQRKQVDILLPFHHVFGMTSPTLNLQAPSFHVGGKTCICLPSDFTTLKMFATSLGATTSKISSVVCGSDPRPSANAVQRSKCSFLSGERHWLQFTQVPSPTIKGIRKLCYFVRTCAVARMFHAWPPSLCDLHAERGLQAFMIGL